MADIPARLFESKCILETKQYMNFFQACGNYIVRMWRCIPDMLPPSPLAFNEEQAEKEFPYAKCQQLCVQ
jgi:hypothetical protein